MPPPDELKGNHLKSGYLVLARHGNTFEPGQKTTWVGAANDLALAAHGWKQAEQVADACQNSGITFDAIYSGPLKRTKDFAATIKEKLKCPAELCLDDRLNEIDYGSWSGLSDEEVAAQFGTASLQAWNKQAIWPQNSDWGSSPEQIIEEIKDFAALAASTLAQGGNVLAVTSNGRLKYFLTIIPDAFAAAQKAETLKVKTGNVCVFSLTDAGANYQCLSWNLPPTEALQPFVSASRK